jgi:hypothetical protein
MPHDRQHCRTTGCGMCCYIWSRLRDRLYHAVKGFPYAKRTDVERRFSQYVAKGYAAR